jgi:hypothetical protein
MASLRLFADRLALSPKYGRVLIDADTFPAPNYSLCTMLPPVRTPVVRRVLISRISQRSRRKG